MSILWGVAVVAGLVPLWLHEFTSGEAGPVPRVWPMPDERATPDSARLTVFAHPRCPCTPATLDAVERIARRHPGRLSVRVAFVRPESVAAGWERTANWDRAGAIPSAEVCVDPGGRLAAAFGAKHSGFVTLYGPDGRLRFAGGLTPSRGNGGPSAGLAALERCLGDDAAVEHLTAPVFGCPLAGAEAPPFEGAVPS